MRCAARAQGAVNGYLLVLCAAVLWGLIGLITPGLLQEGLSALEIAFWRALLGGVLFLIHTMIGGGAGLRRRRDLPVLVAFAAIGVSAFYASLSLAIERGGTSLSFILLYSAPIFVLIGAWLLLRETMTARKVLLTGVAVLGVVLVAGTEGEGIVVTPVSLFWGVLSGLTYASYYIFGKFLLDRYSPAAIYAWIMPLGALGLLPLVDFTHKTITAWLLLAALAVLSTYLAYLVYYTGLKRVEASRAVLVATVEPVVAIALAAAFLGEQLDLTGIVGAVLILGSAVAASLPSRRTAKSAA